jgi:hypothetical protein
MYSYFQTALYAALGKQAAAEISDWELNFYITEAQRQIALVLPDELIPEVVEVANIPPSPTGIGDFGLSSHPTAYAWAAPGMQVISIVGDPVNIATDHTLSQKRFARKVTTEVFFEMIGDVNNTSCDLVWTQEGDILLTSFRTSSTSAPQLLVKYKKAPQILQTSGAFVGRCAHVNVSWDSAGGNNSLLRLRSSTWATLGIAPTDYTNGTVVQGVPIIGTQNTAMACARIIRMWDTDDIVVGDRRGWLEARGPGQLGSSPNNTDIFYELTDTSALIISPSNINYDDQVETPYLSEKWTLPIIDRALSSIWMKLGDKDRSALYMKSFMEQLQMLGASIKGATE